MAKVGRPRSKRERNYRVKRYTKPYMQYREKFYEQKKRGNVKNGVEVLSQKQYKEAIASGMSNRSILKAQVIFDTKKKEEDAWRLYKRVRRLMSRGETVDLGGMETFFGEEYAQDHEFLGNEIGYHYNISGLLHDRRDLHFLISLKIEAGYDRKEVLADYGY